MFCFFTGYSFLVIPLLVFLVLITNKLDAPKSDQWISYYFTACAPLFLTFFTLIMASFGSRGGELNWILHIFFIHLLVKCWKIVSCFIYCTLVWPHFNSMFLHILKDKPWGSKPIFTVIKTLYVLSTLA